MVVSNWLQNQYNKIELIKSKLVNDEGYLLDDLRIMNELIDKHHAFCDNCQFFRKSLEEFLDILLDEALTLDPYSDRYKRLWNEMIRPIDKHLRQQHGVISRLRYRIKYTFFSLISFLFLSSYVVLSSLSFYLLVILLFIPIISFHIGKYRDMKNIKNDNIPTL